MINVLIVNKSNSYGVKLLNSISKKNTEIRITNIVNSIEEMYKFTSTSEFDIILIDSNLLVTATLDKYLDDFMKKHKKSIIILHNENNLIKKYGKFKCVDRFNFDEVLKKILKVASLKTEYQIIRNKIQKELNYLGYKTSHVGTSYLLEAIYTVFSTNFDGSLEGQIYPSIAQKYNKKTNTIKCNIVNATASMFCECSDEKIVNYFGKYNYIKPGPKIVIYTIINKIS